MDRLEVQAHPVAGELVVHRRGFNRRIAKLLAKDGETYLIPLLDKVQLLTINDRGVLLSGYEMHPPRGSRGGGGDLQADVVVRDEPCAGEGATEPGRREGDGAGKGAAPRGRGGWEDDVRTLGQTLRLGAGYQPAGSHPAA